MYYEHHKLVEVTLVDSNGKTLRSYEKDGRIYFGGTKGGRYEIKIRNRSGDRLEIVTTVDGLSVMSGEPGDWRSEGGYVLDAYGTLSIDGYRRNENAVAAFRFTNSDDAAEDSYAGRKDMPDNLGVIGIAVFKEREKPKFDTWPVRYSNAPAAVPLQPGLQGLRRSASDRVYGCRSFQAGAFNAKCDQLMHTSGLDDTLYSAREEAAQAPEIGTEYGEVRESRVTLTSFIRASNSPNQVITVEYDTVENLKRRGIVAPATVKKDAFPGMAEVKPGYAAPPPPKKNKN